MVKILTSVNSDLTSYLNLQLVFIPIDSLYHKNFLDVSSIFSFLNIYHIIQSVFRNSMSVPKYIADLLDTENKVSLN